MSLGEEFIFPFTDKSVHIIFGNKNLEDNFEENNLEFRYLKQIHSPKIIESTVVNNVEADGHFTNKDNVALAIVTADCLPIFVFNQDFIFALHAGWRGLKDKIILNLARFIHEYKVSPDSLCALVGPHIRNDDFEVDVNVGMELFNSLSGIKEGFRKHKSKVFKNTHPNRNKRYVDLSYLALQQFLALEIPEKNIFITPQSTFKDKTYNSYRRDGKTGRNLSFAYSSV